VKRRLGGKCFVLLLTICSSLLDLVNVKVFASVVFKICSGARRALN